MPRPPGPYTYGSLAWCQDELRRLRKLRGNLETERAGLHARCQMLTDMLAEHGLLDETAMREAHTQEIAARIYREHHHRLLEDFHGDIARILQHANHMQATNPDPARGVLINALEAACGRRRRRMQLPAVDVAREEAARQVARIPAEVSYA
jgi:hypothetical protein